MGFADRLLEHHCDLLETSRQAPRQEVGMKFIVRALGIYPIKFTRMEPHLVASIVHYSEATRFPNRADARATGHEAFHAAHFTIETVNTKQTKQTKDTHEKH